MTEGQVIKVNGGRPFKLNGQEVSVQITPGPGGPDPVTRQMIALMEEMAAEQEREDPSRRDLPPVKGGYVLPLVGPSRDWWDDLTGDNQGRLI